MPRRLIQGLDDPRSLQRIIKLPSPQYRSSFRGGNRGGRRPIDRTKVGLFRTRRKELLTGKINDEALENLVNIIKDAKSQGAGVAVFCWVNDFTDNPKAPRYRLSFGVDQQQDDPDAKLRPSRRPIQDNPETGQDDNPDDDPFA